MYTAQYNCYGCGAPVSLDMEKCPYCRGPVQIKTFQNVNEITRDKMNNYINNYTKANRQDQKDFLSNRALAFLFLKVRLYDRAIPYFERAIAENLDDPDLFLYTSVCLLKGKRPFSVNKRIIDQIISYLNAACMIEDKGIYHYFLAYVKFDYFDLKKLRIFPNAVEEMQLARRIGVSPSDTYEFFQLLGTPRPNGF